MALSLTLFNGQGDSKIPFSSYEDGTFIFVTKKIKSLREAHSLLIRNYSLSMPLNIKEPISTLRKKSNLSEYSGEKIDNIILSLNEIYDTYTLENIIDYFKEKNLACLIYRANSFGKNKDLSIQVIIKTNFPSDEKIIRNSLMILQAELQDKCKVDLSNASIISAIPPANNGIILHSRENGNVLKASNISPVLNSKHNSKYLKLSYDDDFIELCLEQFNELGFYASSSNSKNKGIAFYRKNNSSTKKGYYWFLDNPLVMNHKDKNSSVSIYHLMKHTKEGKEWLKSKTKEEQAHQLIKKDNILEYKDYLTCNERY